MHLRPPLRQLATLPTVAMALFAIALRLPPHRPQWLLFPVAAVLMIAPARGLLLTDEHLVFWRLLGRRRLRWTAVTDIEVRTGAVTVTADHVNERLSALRPGWVLIDPDFDRKLALLRQWWLDHGGDRPPT